MFTGIIKAVGKTEIDLSNNRIILYLEKYFLDQINLGDSVSVDGVCLTVSEKNEECCIFQLSEETKRKCVFRDLANVELSMKYNDLVCGHFVTGHVHFMGTVVLLDDSNELWVDVGVEAKYKDSIAINGVSLTIAEVKKNMIKIALIPETIKRTNLGKLQKGDKVNVEFNVPETFNTVNYIRNDAYYMRLAIKEGEKARFDTSPNPWVGCVIVKNGNIIGIGHHKKAGSPHGEVEAINSVKEKEDLEGSTLYTTLEPCCHHGRTPPCTDLIIKNKIKKVIVGTLDPDEKVCGKGLRILLDAGIDAFVLEETAKDVDHSLRSYIFNRKNNLPYCVVKIALSMDNCYRNGEGESKWITCEESRKEGHILRAESQAIIVGANTVQRDDPELTVRYGINVSKQPRVIVFDGESLDKERKIFSRENVIIVPRNNNIKEILPYSLSDNCISYLVEGGAKLQESFFSQKIPNELVIFRSSKIFGSNGYQWNVVPKNTRLTLIEHKEILGDIMEKYSIEYSEESVEESHIECDSFESAINIFKKGGMVLVLDDENRENEGDLVVAASMMTESQMTEMINHTTGIICTPMESSRAKKLNIPLMCLENTDTNKTAFTVSVDFFETGTGVSSKDRLLTVRKLADDQTISTDFRRPGHIFPLIAHKNGLASRRGHTEAAVELCKLAEIYPRVAVISEMKNKDGTMKNRRECFSYAKSNNIPIITIDQIPIKDIKVLSSCYIRSEIGLSAWKMVCLDSGNINHPHKAFIYGKKSSHMVLRIHSECFTGDVFKSRHCDCGKQLEMSMKYITSKGSGIIIFPSEHEGRGIGIFQKARAYELQKEKKLDTYSANKCLGLAEDARTYEDMVKILRYFKIETVELLTENSDKIESLSNFVVKVTPLVTKPNTYSEKYMNEKRKKNPEIITDGLVTGRKIALVYSSWYSEYISQIRNKLKGFLNSYGVFNIDEFNVPGANEIPLKSLKISKDYDSIICIGILIKGDTLHFENISSAVSNGIMQAQLSCGKPMINCVLSCLNIEQVIERIEGDKSTLDYITKTCLYMCS